MGSRAQKEVQGETKQAGSKSCNSEIGEQMMLSLRSSTARVLGMSIVLAASFLLHACDLIRFKEDKDQQPASRKAVARVKDTFLYQDELAGIASDNLSPEDSVMRVTTYINSWVRKQLLIGE